MIETGALDLDNLGLGYKDSTTNGNGETPDLDNGMENGTKGSLLNVAGYWTVGIFKGVSNMFGSSFRCILKIKKCFMKISNPFLHS